MNKLTAKHIMVIIAMCGIVGNVLGFCTNCTGVFFTPIAEEFGIGKGSVSLTVTICSLAMAFTGMVSAKYVTRTSFRKMVLLCTAAMAGSTAALAVCSSIFPMYILQVIRGGACGLIGLVMVTPIVNHWFARNNGLFTSLCVGFSGLTGAIFSPVMTSIIQSAGWHTAYLTMAVIMVIFALPCLLFPIAMYPEDAGTECFGTRPVPAKTSGTNTAAAYSMGLFIIAVFYSIFCCYPTAIPQHFPGIAESFGLSASIGALMVSTAMVCNTGGKVLLGILIDSFGCRKSCMLFLILISVGAASMLTIHNTAGMFLGAALIGLSYSLGSVGIVMAVKDIFGEENYSSVYPKLTLCTTLANSGATALLGLLYDMSGSFTSGLFTILTFPLIAVVLLLAAYRKAKNA